MSLITDQQQRQQALDPSQSFIVQAPAGSGKTTLLTQRFLKLLITVEHDPEEVLAITFTRKAANEMRQRIFSALQLGQKTKPKDSHQLQTWTLARQALQRDQQENWQLLNNPNRLRIQTIDSLCTYLAQQLPLSSRLGSTVNIIENAQQDYTQAVEDTLSMLEEDTPWTASIATLLQHLDNNLATVKNLLITMLNHRDQWLAHVIKARNNKALRQHLESALRNVILDTLQQLQITFPNTYRTELIELFNHAHHMLKQNDQQNPLPSSLNNFPTANLDDLATWQAIATLLLTKKYEWRKSFDKRIGFPSKATDKQTENLLRSFKERMVKLANQLAEEKDLLPLLKESLLLPSPQYNQTQWSILTALLELLPILVAQLNLNFQKAGHIDFIEVTQRALQALTDAENPTDLALALDYKIKHILLDEFQDTSTTQFSLLGLLTRGWQPNDGRTLFLVGDPMQSIYRFRAAEVGLFLQTQRYGIGDIKLISLTLSTNFRSSTTIVEWFNRIFSENFPQKADMSLGAICYTPAIAKHPADALQSIYLHQNDTSNLQNEANAIINIIKACQQQDANQEIAILVRTRRQLLNIIPYLKKVNLPFNAIDLETLDHLSMIQDLMALTLALQHFGNRLAWLSILRAPWCGLILSDLHIIANTNLKKTLWECLNDTRVKAKLSNDGLQRIEKFITALTPILQQRGRFQLAQWVYNAWIRLQGPGTLPDSHQLQDSQLFFSLLANLEKDNSIEKTGYLAETLSTLYAKPETRHKLHIMTIHKAKGLEFDTVIMPSLESIAAPDQAKLLLWQERQTPNNQHDLLLAPIKSRAEQQDSIYHYIRHFEQQKSLYENMRLFYVGITRAKQQLHLLANFDEGNYQPRRNSFLSAIWSQEQYNFKQYYKNTSNFTPMKCANLRRIQTLDLSQNVDDDLATSIPENIPDWKPIMRRNLGTIIHFILQQLNNIPLKQWPSLLQHDDFYQIVSQQHGIATVDLPTILPDLKKTIKNIMASERIKWLFATTHQDIQAEYPLTVQINQHYQQLIIDRTFIDNEIRWIVDYKTTEPHPMQTLEDFLAQEKLRYQTQLENYAEAFHQLSSHPIKLGLYFPLLDAWLQWDH